MVGAVVAAAASVLPMWGMDAVVAVGNGTLGIAPEAEVIGKGAVVGAAG